MPLTKGKKAEEKDGRPAFERDVKNMVMRIAMTVLMNYLSKKFRQNQERKRAAARVEKLQRKGKRVPVELVEEALAGMSKRARKKADRAASAEAGLKKKKKKKSRRRARRVLLLLVLIAAAVAAARAGRSAG